ncbi:hypothetical protein HYX16_06450 [Candidatus Woesearchaeota archaeon]|nr:hypothetical protein [Candidatus Woesearchaeota archaeon]
MTLEGITDSCITSMAQQSGRVYIYMQLTSPRSLILYKAIRIAGEKMGEKRAIKNKPLRLNDIIYHMKTRQSERQLMQVFCAFKLRRYLQFKYPEKMLLYDHAYELGKRFTVI